MKTLTTCARVRFFFWQEKQAVMSPNSEGKRGDCGKKISGIHLELRWKPQYLLGIHRNEKYMNHVTFSQNFLGYQ